MVKNIEVPTGNILLLDGDKGKLECLSLGDYGKNVNLNQHRRVDHGDVLPLFDKWVCTISTQYGCSIGCRFCDVPMVGPGVNATLTDLCDEVAAVIALHPDIAVCHRFNIHYARMGEPTFNINVLEHARVVKAMYSNFNIHPVVSTMMPDSNRNLEYFIREWCIVKNTLYHGEAGLQLSINSTSENERAWMFSGKASPIEKIASIMDRMPDPVGRKYTLNFAIAGYTIDAERLASLFPPSRFVCKLTPMHKTASASSYGIETSGDYTEPYPYQADEDRLKDAGFDTLVFIASEEEDVSRITCGNAILSDARVAPQVKAWMEKV